MDFLLNSLGVILILLIAIVLGMKEWKEINNYGKEDFSLISSAIKFLKDKQTKETITKEECNNNHLFFWLTKHLDGDIYPNYIHPKKDNNNLYLLSSYPNILSKSVPRSNDSRIPTRYPH